MTQTISVNLYCDILLGITPEFSQKETIYVNARQENTKEPGEIT